MSNRYARKKNLVPRHMAILADGSVDLQAAAGEDGEVKTLRSFSISAYTGGPLVVAGFYYPVVVDISGCRAAKGQLPVLRDHNLGRVIGHATEARIGSGRIEIEGLVSGAGSDSAEVVQAAANGFVWKASIGAKIVRSVFVPEGRSVTANGMSFTGPIYVARKSILREVSIVAIGADERAETRIAATAENQNNNSYLRSITMKFNEWLEANGWDHFDELSETQQTNLRAAFDAQNRPATEEPNEEPQPEPAVDLQATVHTAIGQERDRIRDIEAMCNGFWGDQADHVTELRAQAISGQIDNDDLARKLLTIRRDLRPAAPAVHTRGRQLTGKVIEAAACLSAMVPEPLLLASYGQETLQCADEQFRGVGLRGIIHLAAMSEGIMLPEFTTNPNEWIRAAFSTNSLPGILGNIANRKLEEGFSFGDQSWRNIAKIGSVSDFKPHKRYRLLGNMTFLPVGPDGELKHGELGEMERAIEADTSGILFGITRKQLINDDLGAFLEIPHMIGMGWNDAISDAVWSLWLSNAGEFFSVGNKNYLVGTDTALTIAGLTRARTQFLKQTKPQVGKEKPRPLGVQPSRLLVPVELEETADRLIKATDLNYGGDEERSNYNPHKGKYDIVTAPALSNDSFSGNSGKAWYLLADPARLPAIEVAFLNGRQKPVIEQSDQAFNVLGKQFRGYGDFGVALQEHRAALKMKGEA